MINYKKKYLKYKIKYLNLKKRKYKGGGIKFDIEKNKWIETNNLKYSELEAKLFNNYNNAYIEKRYFNTALKQILEEILKYKKNKDYEIIKEIYNLRSERDKSKQINQKIDKKINLTHSNITKIYEKFINNNISKIEASPEMKEEMEVSQEMEVSPEMEASPEMEVSPEMEAYREIEVSPEMKISQEMEVSPEMKISQEMEELKLPPPEKELFLYYDIMRKLHILDLNEEEYADITKFDELIKNITIYVEENKENEENEDNIKLINITLESLMPITESIRGWINYTSLGKPIRLGYKFAVEYLTETFLNNKQENKYIKKLEDGEIILV